MSDAKASEDANETPKVPPFPDLGRADGPWSFADAPATQAFVSFGPLKVPTFPTLHATLEIDAKTKLPAAVSIAMEQGSIHLQVFASPRGAGLWGSVRRQLARRVIAARGTAQAVEGEFGTELIVNRPLIIDEKPVGALVNRCVGIEGDRWMLRAVVGGREPVSDECVTKVNAFLSRCAVERGDAAFSPGSIMPLKLPEGGATVSTETLDSVGDVETEAGDDA